MHSVENTVDYGNPFDQHQVTSLTRNTMMVLPPQLVEKASIETVAVYFHEGRKRLRSAMAQFPALLPWEALIQRHERGGPIRGKTARKYLQEDVRTLALCLRHKQLSSIFAEVAKRLKDAIDGRRGRPPKYGSGKKVKDVTEAEAIAVFNELKSNALAKAYMTDALVALFVLVAAHSGLRPIEMIGTSVDGTILTLQNAKQKPGLGPIRRIDLAGLPADVLIAVRLLIAMIPNFASRAKYRAWAKDLAEALARACKRAGIRRLSLYSFRHLSLATWKRAGVSAHDLAELAGHLSQKSARNYAGARFGHRRISVVRPARLPVEYVAPQPLQRSSATAGSLPVETADQIIWDELPVPREQKLSRRQALEPSAVKQYFERLAADVDAAGTKLSERRRVEETAQIQMPNGNDHT